MARKSAMGLVLSQMIPVDPDGDQSAYYRSKRNVQTSEKLARHQSCVADEMEGKNFTGRAEVRDAFSQASSSCKGR
jgi:hypothetical protein